MQGFGSDDLGLTKPGQPPQHVDIHNKPPPKNFWHAASRLASTTWDVVKPTDDKKGHNGSDARKAAGDAILVLTGVCKYSGHSEPVDKRVNCPCAGCQSHDNSAELRRRQEFADLEVRRQEAAQKAADKKRAEAELDAKRTGYVPPSMFLPGSEPQSQRRGPWGPAPNERREERNVEQQSPASKPDSAPAVDLLGGEEQASPFGFVNADPASTDLLGDEPSMMQTTDLLGGETQESRDLTNLLMSHAAVDDEDEADLIGLAPTPEAKPSEQLDGLF